MGLGLRRRHAAVVLEAYKSNEATRHLIIIIINIKRATQTAYISLYCSPSPTRRPAPRAMHDKGNYLFRSPSPHKPTCF